MQLAVGDEVEFAVLLNAKTKEPNAKRITRLSAAASAPPANSPVVSQPPKLRNASPHVRNPSPNVSHPSPGANPKSQTPELVASARPAHMKLTGGPSGLRATHAMRMPKMPDGTRGFSMGRGAGLKSAAAGVGAVPPLAPGSLAVVPVSVGIARSASGKLDPGAPAFVPRSSSGGMLSHASSESLLAGIETPV